MAVQIVEVLRRSEQGLTKPFICRAEDGEIYFVKGKDAGRDSQICEWVAGRLAQLIGLPIAPYSVVYVPEELLELGVGLDLGGLGTGPAFGSRRCSANELTFSGVEGVSDDLQQDVFVFDWWVKNGDRILTEHGGNPNLLWDPENKKLVVIDHNQAFDFTVEYHDFVDFHIFSRQINKLSGAFSRRDEYNGKLGVALQAWDEIISEVPECWWFADAEMTVSVDFDVKKIHTLLKLYEEDEFWTWK